MAARLMVVLLRRATEGNASNGRNVQRGNRLLQDWNLLVSQLAAGIASKQNSPPARLPAASTLEIARLG